MIDLNYRGLRSADSRKKEEDTPVGAQILMILPMAMLFWSLIEWGLR